MTARWVTRRPSRSRGASVAPPLAGSCSEFFCAAGAALVDAPRELGRDDATVIATGGLAGIVADSTDAFDVVDGQLTIKGICEIYRRMQELG